MRPRPWQLCVCVCSSSNVRTQHHTLEELCSSRLQPRPAALWQGPFGHAAPSGRHIPPTTLCHISFPPASLCCAAVQLGSARHGPAHKTHQLGLGSSAGLPWGTAAKVGWNPTAILSAATALLSPLTSSSICHRRPYSKRNRQRQDASCKMKWNCCSSQHHPKKEGAKMKYFLNSKDDNYYMRSYSLDSFYNIKPLTNMFTLPLEDTCSCHRFAQHDVQSFTILKNAPEDLQLLMQIP